MFTMEGTMITKQACAANTTSSPLAMHKNSHIITKVKPKIRIIHIFAPEIIKTDAANFRELVQRLTGKPTENKKKKIKPTRTTRKAELRPSRFSEFRETIKGEEEIWGGGNQSNGGFLGGFQDLDGFMQELNGFQTLPLVANSHMDSIGGTQIA